MFRHIKCLLTLLTCLCLLGCIFPKIDVCFTPSEKCTDQIINAIDQSKKFVLIQAYVLTSKPIAESLIRAKNRGIDIRVILDKAQAQSKYSVINELSRYEIPIWIDFQPAIAHNKIIIIDNKKVITGSFNFTASAELRNAENLLIITNNSELVKKYVRNWKYRQSQSRAYVPLAG